MTKKYYDTIITVVTGHFDMMQEENIFAGIRLADDCFCDKPNIQQFVQTWQKTSSEGFDYGCLKGFAKIYTKQQNKLLERTEYVSTFASLSI